MLAILCTAFLAKAQDTGYISGTVTDKIRRGGCRRRSGNHQHRRQPDAHNDNEQDGAYVVAGLPGGTYDIMVTAKGFQKYTAHGVVLDVAQKIRVDVQLTVGSVSEEVVVTGESVAQVETPPRNSAPR